MTHPRALTGILLLPLLLAAAAPEADPPSAPAPRPVAVARQRGVSWVAGPALVTAEHLRPLRDRHVNWIVQTPFGWQKTVDTPEVHLVTGGRIYWGETDEGLGTTTGLAQELGIRTLLKPHIWLTSYDGTWRGQIAMKDEESWRRWFASYRRFILHYARLAERSGIAALCVGTELHGTVARERDWRKLIAAVRDAYGGKLTYAANWNLEFEQVPFWDALDFIGIQGYFPLTDRERPTVDDLKRGWTPWVEAIEKVQRRVGKPVIFTEIGYKSTVDGAIRPWEWPQRDMASRVDLRTQANGYRAFFEVFWGRDWLAGVYFWKWYPARDGSGVGREFGFTPQGKPAEKILTSWYGRSAGTGPRATGE